MRVSRSRSHHLFGRREVAGGGAARLGNTQLAMCSAERDVHFALSGLQPRRHACAVLRAFRRNDRSSRLDGYRPIAAMSASAKRTPQSRLEADIKRLREPSHLHNARRHCLQGPLKALPDRAFGMSAQHARGRSLRPEKVDDARGLKFA
jgi:hypothetical protein